MQMSRKAPLFALFAAAALLALAAWHRGRAPDAMNEVDAAGSIPGAQVVARAIPAPRMPMRVDHIDDSPRALALRADFEGADDLYAYAQGLQVKEAQGDADALWMANRVLDYCAGYAADPAAYATDTRTISTLQGAAITSMVAARERIGRRCARFVPDDGFSLQARLAGKTEAAKAGSLAAEAALLAMGDPLSDDSAYKRDLVARVRRSGDPEAYLALSSAMGIAASGQEATFGDISGTQYAELAWTLAACRLGADCSAGSTLMTSYCVNGGICSRDRSQDFASFVFDAGVPRQGGDDLNKLVDSLILGLGVAG
jgi:hypothetical protein